jgi:glutamate decarboxylase
MPNEIIKALGPFEKKEASLEELIESFKTTFHYSARTMHPFFCDKLWNGSDPIGQTADLITSVLNTAVHVFHVAPVASVMEIECVKEYAEKFGFDRETCEGVMNPGGTMSNIMAVVAARHKYFPHVRKEGWKAGDNPVGYTAGQSHYSVNRGAMVTGMGMDNFRKIPCDRMTGAMKIDELEK